MNTTKVQLSCNHRIDVQGTPEVGDKAICGKCTAKNADAGMVTRTRRIKRILSVSQAEPVAADERDAAEARIAELREAAGTVTLRGRTHHQVQAAEDHLAEVLVTNPDQPWSTVVLRGTHADLVELIHAAAASVLDGTPTGRGANVALNSLRRAVERDAGDRPVTAEDVAAEQQLMAAAIGSLATVAWGTLAAEAPAELDEYDPVLASAEYRAVKEWKANGSVGDEPAAPNFAAMLAANAGGTQRRRKAGSKKATTSKPRTSARRAAANKVQADTGFEGRKAAGVVKWSDEELVAWIRQVLADHPDTRKEDELEVAYWIERVAVSRDRFYRVWADATAPEGEAPSAD